MDSMQEELSKILMSTKDMRQERKERLREEIAKWQKEYVPRKARSHILIKKGRPTCQP